MCVAFVVCSILAMQASVWAGLVMDSETKTEGLSVFQICGVTPVNVSFMKDVFNGAGSLSSAKCSVLNFTLNECAANLARQIGENSRPLPHADFLDTNKIENATDFEIELRSGMSSQAIRFAAN